MQRLEPIILPAIAFFTNIGEPIARGFPAGRKRRREKLRLFTNAEVLIYCSDQPETVTAVNDWAAGLTGAGAPLRSTWGMGMMRPCG